MMKTIEKTRALILLIMIITLSYSCEKNDEENKLCGQEVIIDHNRYNDDISDMYWMVNAVIQDDGCLNIEISASGCDGNNMTAELIAEEVDGFPSGTRNIRLILDDEEDCEAIVLKDFTFDLEALKEDGNDVNVILEDFDRVLVIR